MNVKNTTGHRTLARHRVMRLLTFVCFFNFSGLNNGYTYLASVSPLDLRQSVSLTGGALQRVWSSMHPSAAFSSLQEGFHRLSRLSRERVEAGKEDAAGGRTAPALLDGGGRRLGSREGRGGVEMQERNYVRERQIYIKDKKQGWRELRSQAGLDEGVALDWLSPLGLRLPIRGGLRPAGRLAGACSALRAKMRWLRARYGSEDDGARSFAIDAPALKPKFDELGLFIVRPYPLSAFVGQGG